MATMFPALVRLEVMLASSVAAAAAEAPARAAAAARSPYKNPLQQTSGMMIEDRRPTTRNSPAKRPEQLQIEAQTTQGVGISPSMTMAPVALPASTVKMTEEELEIHMKNVKAKHENALFCMVCVDYNNTAFSVSKLSLGSKYRWIT